MIVAFPPIQTSLPMTVSPRDGRSVTRSMYAAHAPPMIGNGKVGSIGDRSTIDLRDGLAGEMACSGGQYEARRGKAFATFLTPGSQGDRWDTARICAFGELLAF